LKNPGILRSISAATLLETMAEGVMLIATDGTIQLWNKAMTDITGYSAEEMLGMTTDSLRAPECMGAGQIFGLFSRTEQKDACVNGCECRMIARSGEKIPIVVNARILKDSSGETLGILQTLTDFRPVFNLQQQIAAMNSRLQSEENFAGITGRSVQMQKVFRLIKLAADSDASVIIFGESGTGKELVAEAVQKLSSRQGKPFIKVNCGAIPETLLESELFGHEKGAFTGAIKRHIGRFEAADKGTIFLDEIGDISPAMQVKLLRVIQNGELQRVGGSETIKVSARVITATNKDLTREVREGRFREDLFYRLRVFPIHMPPLRDRHEDIPLLAQHFINRFSARTGKLINGMDRKGMNMLTAHNWPGNVRELENAIEYAFVVCQQKTISSDDLPPDLNQSFADKRSGNSHALAAESNKIGRSSPESSAILNNPAKLATLLDDCSWNKAEAGRILGVSRTAVWKWILKHKLDKK